MRILITGGLGFQGSHLAEHFHKKGHEITILNTFSNRAKTLLEQFNLPWHCVWGSITDRELVEKTIRDHDVVFHLAVKPLGMSFDKPEEVVKVNDYGTYLVARTCTELKCKMIHVSSSEAYGTAMKKTMSEDHPLLPTTIFLLPIFPVAPLPGKDLNSFTSGISSFLFLA